METFSVTSSGAGAFTATMVNMDGNVVISLVGELDMDTVSDLNSVLAPVIKDGPSRVVLDCSDLSFIDSSGLAVFVTTHNQIVGQGRQLVIRSPRANIMRLFETMNLQGLLNIETG